MNLLFREGLSFSGFERDALFLNLESRGFQDISGVSGIDSISDGRAAVLADFDNDGDLDIFLTATQGEGHLLFKNNVGQANNFIRVVLEGRDSGRDAFGAVVRLKTAHGVQTRVCSGGNGFLAQPDPRLLFGLGQKEEAEWMEVLWPSGRTQRFGRILSGASAEDRRSIGRLRNSERSSCVASGSRLLEKILPGTSWGLEGATTFRFLTCILWTAPTRRPRLAFRKEPPTS